MIFTCPACGASSSLEAWLNDKEWRELVALIPKIPAQIQGRAISYMGLWRTGKRALKPGKALTILEGLVELVGVGTVHWEGGETRPAPVELWAQALDAVIERRPQALTSHNYLRHTAWDMAAGLAAEKENITRRRGDAGGAEKELDSRLRGNDDLDQEEEKPKRRGCFRCESFRPPKGCGAGLSPVAGNMVMGCGEWREKGVKPVGELFGGLAEKLRELGHEAHEGYEEKGKNEETQVE